MSTTAVPISAKLEFLQGIHQPSDVYKIALYASKAKNDEQTTVYSSLNEVEAKGYEAGGKILEGCEIIGEKGSAILDFLDPVWRDSTIAARSLLIYNSTKANKAIAVFNFEEVVSSTNDDFTVKIPGLIRLI